MEDEGDDLEPLPEPTPEGWEDDPEIKFAAT